MKSSTGNHTVEERAECGGGRRGIPTHLDQWDVPRRLEGISQGWAVWPR